MKSVRQKLSAEDASRKILHRIHFIGIVQLKADMPPPRTWHRRHLFIRTASKRAYLYGEGQKRQQWGISTVVVNGRRGGCPLCTPYIGRVFIDDVYSGGKRDASSGNTYPLLSEAIKSGLFHPNCKDSTSTYYEGITTLQPVTEEEQAEMERREQLEQRQSYYENQAKKNRRIAEYSLDADNKRTYSHRAEVFEQKAQNAEKVLANSGEKGKRVLNRS